MIFSECEKGIGRSVRLALQALKVTLANTRYVVIDGVGIFLDHARCPIEGRESSGPCAAKCLATLMRNYSS
jgi:hypothetical protein